MECGSSAAAFFYGQLEQQPCLIRKRERAPALHAFPFCRRFSVRILAHRSRGPNHENKPSVTLLAAVAFAPSPTLLLAQVDPKWEIHDRNRPNPPVITPGTASTQEAPGKPPSDAIVLFDGKDLSQWVEKKDGSPAKWKVENGYFEVAPKTGDIRTKDSFGDCQLHVEFREPDPPKGEDQDRGNSGVSPDGALRNPGTRFLQQQDVRGRAGIRGVWPVSAAGERFARTRPVADLRHHLARPALRRIRQTDSARARHRVSQRRSHARQRGAHRTHGPSRPSAVRSGPGQAAARTAGSQSPGPLPQHLDSRTELGTRWPEQRCGSRRGTARRARSEEFLRANKSREFARIVLEPRKLGRSGPSESITLRGLACSCKIALVGDYAFTREIALALFHF